MDRNSSPAADSAPAAGARQSLWKTLTATSGVLLAGLLVLLQATEGGNAFTTETLRRTAIEREAQAVPALAVKDADGLVSDLHHLLSTQDRVWIVDFVYTRCTSVCLAQGSVTQQLQAKIVDRGLQSKVGLVSISFDPQADDSAALRAYATRMRMDPVVWHVLSLTSPGDRGRLLDAFGIIVIPAPLGQFEHNAALHIVDRHGMLVRILDLEDADQALDWALAAAR